MAAKTQPKFPQVSVDLAGTVSRLDVVQKVRLAMRKAGLERGLMDQFARQALEGDLEHVKSTAEGWVSVIGA